MNYYGSLYTVSAPSGAGKTSLVRALVEATSNLCVSVSHTTRDKRPGEQDGVNYHFVSPNQFLAMAEKGDFLEHAKVFNHHYGTSADWVEQARAAGSDVILEIDWQGAHQIREKIADAISVFILPPSEEALRQRLTSRATDDEQVINARMAEAKSEMSHYHESHYVLVNDQFDEALAEFVAIIAANRLRLEKQQRKHHSLITRLLS